MTNWSKAHALLKEESQVMGFKGQIRVERSVLMFVRMHPVFFISLMEHLSSEV